MTGWRSPRVVIVTLIFFLMMIGFADRLVLGLAATSIVRDLGITQTQFGLLGSAFFLFYSLSAALFGRLADRHASTRLIAGLALGAVLAHAPVLLSATFAGAMASRILLGVTHGPLVPLGLHATYSWFDARERSWPTSVVVGGTAAGATIGGPGLAWVIEHWGWQAAYALMAALILLWSVVWLQFAREGPRDTPVEQRSDPRQLAVSNAWVVISLLILAALVAHGVGIIGVLWAAPFLQVVGGMSLSEAGWQISANALGTVAAVFLFGALDRSAKARPGRRAVSSVAPGALQAMGGLALLAMGALPFGWVSLLLMFFGFTLVVSIFVLAPPMLAALAPPGRRGAVLGVYGACYVIGGLVSPILTGKMLDASPSLAVGLGHAFAVAGLSALFSGIVLLLFGRPSLREREAPAT